MHVKLRNMPKLRLADLLRRRKMTLEQFINESGIAAYGALVERCTALGVQPPIEDEYNAVVKVQVSSQQDGVVVLEPLPEPVPEEIVFIPEEHQLTFDLEHEHSDNRVKKSKKNKDK